MCVKPAGGMKPGVKPGGGAVPVASEDDEYDNPSDYT